MSSTLIDNSIKQAIISEQAECELMSLVMSFIYNRKIRGPRTVPCGTPDITKTGLEDSLFTLSTLGKPGLDPVISTAINSIIS